jgi:AcrR family transcriptional regulator
VTWSTKEVAIAASSGTDGRRQRSLRTRTRIVDAATRLFVERGYVATTIEDVADAAGVAVQTVYYLFGTKPSVLAGVLDASIAGDAEPVALLDRPSLRGILAAPDPSAAVELLVDESVGIVARTAPVYEVVRRAAADPDVGALLDANRGARRADQRRLVEMLADGGHLRPGVDVDTAADVLYAVMNEEVYRLLVVDCGWDIDRFRTWLVTLLTDQLIR